MPADIYVVTDGGMRNLATGDVVPDQPSSGGGLVGIYNGSTPGSDDAVITASGITFDTGSTYYNAGQNLLGALDLERLARGQIPLVGMASKNYQGGGPTSFMDWAGIGAGEFDAKITTWGNQLAAYDTEIWFAFEIEPEVKMNRGDVPSTWTEAEFAAAFRRIVSIMRPLCPKVQFCFWVGGSDTAKIAQMWPGDEWVDRFGWDPYVTGGNPSTNTPMQEWSSFKTWATNQGWDMSIPHGLFECGFDRGHGTAAAITFWEAAPSAFKDLGLSHITMFNRDSGPNTNAEILDQSVWDAYGAAMRAIQAGEG